MKSAAAFPYGLNSRLLGSFGGSLRVGWWIVARESKAVGLVGSVALRRWFEVVKREEEEEEEQLQVEERERR